MDLSTDLDLGGTPPVMQGALPMEPADPAWPKVIGVISLIYALGGLLCSMYFAASSFFMESMMKMGGLDVQAPAIVKATGAATGCLLLILGVVMLVGSIGLLRRRQSSVKLLKLWAVLRVALILVGAIITILTAPAQIQFQRSIHEAQVRKMEQSNTKWPLPTPDDAALWRQTMIIVAAFSTAVAVYPTFLGFYLSRKKITMQVEQWR